MKTSLIAPLVLALVLTGCNKSTSANSDETASTGTGSTFASTHADTTSSGATKTTSDLRNAADSAANAIGNAASNVAVTARMAEWKLNSSDIQTDLNDNKEIVRTKEANAQTPTGSADKSVIESMVRSRFEADSDLASLKIKVSADRHGAVKLSGKAESAEEVGRAVAIALDTEGVTKVTSKIKLDKDAKTNQ